jgi:hypothetical protein
MLTWTSLVTRAGFLTSQIMRDFVSLHLEPPYRAKTLTRIDPQKRIELWAFPAPENMGR